MLRGMTARATKTKPDRRTARTRAALLHAFNAILLDEGHDAVTVERVSAVANVGRSTFYMHFAGKDDILRVSLTHPSSALAAIAGDRVPLDQLVRQLEHFREQRKRNAIFFAWPIRPIWVSCLAGLIETELRSARFRGRAARVPPALIASGIAEAQIALVAHWLLRAGAHAKPHALAETLSATTLAMVDAGFRS